MILCALASADQSHPEGEEQDGEGGREYVEGLRTEQIEIAGGGEHVSQTRFRFLQSYAEVRESNFG